MHVLSAFEARGEYLHHMCLLWLSSVQLSA